MHAHRVLGDGSWTRGKRPKSTNVARNKQAGVHGFELPLERAARQVMAVQHSFSLKAPRALSPRALTSRNADDARPPISLQGSAHESRPDLFSRQGPSRGPSSTGGSTTCRAVRSAGTVRRSGASSPAFPPRNPTPASSSQFLYRSNHLFSPSSREVNGRAGSAFSPGQFTTLAFQT